MRSFYACQSNLLSDLDVWARIAINLCLILGLLPIMLFYQFLRYMAFRPRSVLDPHNILYSSVWRQELHERNKPNNSTESTVLAPAIAFCNGNLRHVLFKFHLSTYNPVFIRVVIEPTKFVHIYRAQIMVSGEEILIFFG
jgi:hypothetical protein